MILIGIDGNEANVRNRVGANVYAYNILDYLHKKAAEKKLRFQIYLKDKPLSDLPEENANWQYQVFGPGRLWTQWRLPLKLYLEEEKPSLFFTPGHYAPRFCPVPTVISIMDLAFLTYPKDFKRSDLEQLTAWTKYSVKKASHIFAISEATKKDIIKYYRVDENKVTVTYPGIDIAKLKVNKENQAVKDKYSIKDDYLIFIGTLQPRKNLVRLIRSFSTISKRHPQLSLVIVGKKGWLYKEIFQTVKELELTKKVIFTGFVPDEELPTLLKGAEAYVLPSLYEGFGIPVVEAMELGIPVVVSRISSLPELVGEAGVYIEEPTSNKSISQALLKVIKLTDKQRKELIIKGKIQAKKFSWNECGEKTLEILRKIGAGEYV